MRWWAEHVVVPILVAAVPALVEWLRERPRCGEKAPSLPGADLVTLGWTVNAQLDLRCPDCSPDSDTDDGKATTT